MVRGSLARRAYSTLSPAAGRAFASSATPAEKSLDEAVSSSFKASDLQVVRCGGDQRLPENLDDLKFGSVFSPHVLSVRHSNDKGWEAPIVKPLENLSIHPSAPVFHYGVGCFEGMKAYASKKKEGDILLFRPDMNMKRFALSMSRLCLPSFDTDELLGCLKRLLDVDKSFVPRKPGFSIYIRPLAIGITATLGVAPASHSEISIMMCPVGPYYPGGLVPIDILLDESKVRAFPGGTGQYKIGGNYAPTLFDLKSAAEDHGCKQVLYTMPTGSPTEEGGERVVAECGAMNMFFLLQHAGEPFSPLPLLPPPSSSLSLFPSLSFHVCDCSFCSLWLTWFVFFVFAGGEVELATPPLDGTILAGVTRDTILELCRGFGTLTVSERTITTAELERHASQGTLLEIFGSGTACIIQPVKRLVRKNGEALSTRRDTPKEDMVSEQVYKAITDIQYGRIDHPWAQSIYS